VIGREEPADPRALGCAEFEDRSSPGLDARTSEPALSSLHLTPPVLGTFVPIEQELALAQFHRALGRLLAGDDDDGKVRILAYGASHTQADAYPGYLRAYLQSRFGNGGRGFVPLGRVNTWHRTLDTRVRHRLLTVHHARSGADVAREPLGLFGAALVGRHGDAFGEITTAEESQNTRFEVHYWTQPGGGDFGLYVDGRRLARIPTKGDGQAPGYYLFEATPGRHQIRVQLRGNGPVRLFGIVAETANPGLVVDTLGIGGSRMGGHLHWDEDGWIEAVRRRKPDLVTFAYGTNEAADKHLPIPAYEMQLRAVLSRLRKALPEVSCVLIAPFDLPLSAHSRLVSILDAQRRISKEFGCGFWDAHRFMGGKGSIRRWASAKPPLASSDHIHLTRRGYAYAGLAIGDALMRVYDLNPAHFAGEAIVAAPPSLPFRAESSGSGLPSMRER
jgi:hypothetical protein